MLEHVFNQSCKMGSQSRGLYHSSPASLHSPNGFSSHSANPQSKSVMDLTFGDQGKKEGMSAKACTTVFICFWFSSLSGLPFKILFSAGARSWSSFFSSSWHLSIIAWPQDLEQVALKSHYEDWLHPLYYSDTGTKYILIVPVNLPSFRQKWNDISPYAPVLVPQLQPGVWVILALWIHAQSLQNTKFWWRINSVEWEMLDTVCCWCARAGWHVPWQAPAACLPSLLLARSFPQTLWSSPRTLSISPLKL